MSIETFDRNTNRIINQDEQQQEREAALRIVTGKEFLGHGRHIVDKGEVDPIRYHAPDSRNGNGTHRAEPLPLPASEPTRVE